MPYTLRKVKNKRCYSVSNKKGNKKSRCSTRKNAKKQIRLLNALNKNSTFRKMFRGGLKEGWTEHIDPKTGNPFLHNETTGEIEWKEEWTTHTDPGSGKEYLYNTKTGESKWKDEQPQTLGDASSETPMKVENDGNGDDQTQPSLAASSNNSEEEETHNTDKYYFQRFIDNNKYIKDLTEFKKHYEMVEFYEPKLQRCSFIYYLRDIKFLLVTTESGMGVKATGHRVSYLGKVTAHTSVNTQYKPKYSFEINTIDYDIGKNENGEDRSKDIYENFKNNQMRGFWLYKFRNPYKLLYNIRNIRPIHFTEPNSYIETKHPNDILENASMSVDYSIKLENKNNSLDQYFIYNSNLPFDEMEKNIKLVNNTKLMSIYQRHKDTQNQLSCIIIELHIFLQNIYHLDKSNPNLLML
jgi:hypothetical protein